MWEAAETGGVDPDRVSFTAALCIARRSTSLVRDVAGVPPFLGLWTSAAAKVLVGVPCIRSRQSGRLLNRAQLSGESPETSNHTEKPSDLRVHDPKVTVTTGDLGSTKHVSG
jgi:hypothetical protein